jgi:hypothetical protein
MAATYITESFFQAIEDVVPGSSIYDSWQAFKAGMRAVAPGTYHDEIDLYYITVELYEAHFSFGFGPVRNLVSASGMT